MSQFRPFSALSTDLISAMVEVQKTNLDQLNRKHTSPNRATLNYEAQQRAEIESVLACAYAELQSRAWNQMKQETTPKPQWMKDAETDPLMTLLDGVAAASPVEPEARDCLTDLFDKPAMTAGPNPIPVSELLNQTSAYDELSAAINNP